MAKRTVDPAQFARHYPPGTAEKCYEAALVIQRECEITTQIRTHRESMSSGTSGTSTTSSFHEERAFQQQPPSWADVGMEEQQQQPPRGYYHQQQQYPPPFYPEQGQYQQYHHHQHHQYQEPPRQDFLFQQPQPQAPDVFSSMGHWQCEKPKGRFFQARPQYQPPRGVDVFQDVGVWDNSLPQQQAQAQNIVPMPVDPYAPTPPPTFQPYPPMCSPSTSSSVSVADAPEEKNSWKSFDFLLNQMPSTSSNLQ